MTEFSEMNTKVKVSIGLLLSLIAATFFVTSFYFGVVSIDDKLDEMDKEIQTLRSKVNELEKTHIE